MGGGQSAKQHINVQGGGVPGHVEYVPSDMAESGSVYAGGADRCELGGLPPASPPPYMVRSAQPLPWSRQTHVVQRRSAHVPREGARQDDNPIPRLLSWLRFLRMHAHRARPVPSVPMGDRYTGLGCQAASLCQQALLCLYSCKPYEPQQTCTAQLLRATMRCRMQTQRKLLGARTTAFGSRSQPSVSIWLRPCK